MLSAMKILFVCLGNICRSPAAEAVCRDLLEKRSITGVSLDSVGTSAYHQGDSADGRMRKAAARRGVTISHASRQLKKQDLDRFDLILAMDRDNYRDIIELASDHGQKQKVRLFRDYDPEGTGDVPDPYFGGRGGFELVMDMLTRTCDNLIETLSEQEYGQNTP